MPHLKSYIKTVWSRYSKDPLVIKGAIILGIVFIVMAFCWSIIAPPRHFPTGDIFEVKQGENLLDISQRLEDGHFVRSAFILRSVVFIFGDELRIMRGFYYFTHPQNVVSIAYRIMHGTYGIDSVRVTIPEGTNRYVMSDILASQLPGFSKEEFLEKTKEKEGYLFPDTYVFLPHVSVDTVIQALASNYERRIAPLRAQFESFGKTEKEIITMASIVEGEARQADTRKIVAGILWKRISINMPLQVDTAFVYINGKTTYTLTSADLADTSPYNTYVHKGLPPTPISSPGLGAIQATITPTKTKYLYFLTGRDGVMYYAATHDEHVYNKKTYLR